MDAINIDHVFFINLDRRQDRFEKMTQELKRVGLDKISTRFSAIDGKKITELELEKQTSPICSKFCLKSLIGCAMSHIKLWNHFYYNTDYNQILILEDDVFFKKANPLQFLKENDHLTPKEFDIFYLDCFFGYNENPNILTNMISIMNGSGFLNEKKYVNEFVSEPHYPLGAHAYILTRTGAKKLIDLISQIDSHIDAKIADNVNKNKLIAYRLKEPLVTQIGTIEDTDNLEYNFPLVINKLLDSIKFKNASTLGYIFNASNYIIPYLDIQVNLYILIVLLLGLGLVISKKFDPIKVLRIYLFFSFLDIYFGKPKNLKKSIIISLFYLILLFTPFVIKAWVS